MKIINKQKILLKKYTKYILLTLMLNGINLFGMDNPTPPAFGIIKNDYPEEIAIEDYQAKITEENKYEIIKYGFVFIKEIIRKLGDIEKSLDDIYKIYNFFKPSKIYNFFKPSKICDSGNVFDSDNHNINCNIILNNIYILLNIRLFIELYIRFKIFSEQSLYDDNRKKVLLYNYYKEFEYCDIALKWNDIYDINLDNIYDIFFKKIFFEKDFFKEIYNNIHVIYTSLLTNKVLKAKRTFITLNDIKQSTLEVYANIERYFECIIQYMEYMEDKYSATLSPKSKKIILLLEKIYAFKKEIKKLKKEEINKQNEEIERLFRESQKEEIDNMKEESSKEIREE